jgi:hypothetical protein
MLKYLGSIRYNLSKRWKYYRNESFLIGIDRYEHELLKSMDPSIFFTIIPKKNITKHINNQLATFCQKFTQGFLATHSVKKN